MVHLLEYKVAVVSLCYCEIPLELEGARVSAYKECGRS